MENNNLLVQFLVAGISGGIIILLIYLARKLQNVNIKLGKKFGIILIMILVVVSIILLTL